MSESVAVKENHKTDIDMRNIKYIVLHCTAGNQKQKAEDVVRFHTGPKENGCLGWSVAGYHYIIEADGTVRNIVPLDRNSNGVKGYNSVSVHVCWIGGMGGIDNRTPAQKEALLRLVRELRKKYPQAEIRGHRDFSEDKNGNGVIDPWERMKECPCFEAKTEYKDI